MSDLINLIKKRSSCATYHVQAFGVTLNTNLKLDSEKSRCRIQYSGQNNEVNFTEQMFCHIGIYIHYICMTII